MERHFLNDPSGMGNLAGEYDAQGNLISRYGYGLGLVSKDDHFYTFAGNGNTSEITSSADEVVNTYAYDPFGTPLAETEGITNAFKFSGQLGVRQTDDDLLYMRNRFYSPSLGRFMTEDPIGLAGGDVGFYRYVQNNPVNSVDPEGLIAAQIVGGGVGLIFGGVSGYISSGGDWGATARSAFVGLGAGVLSTVGIPGAQAVLGNYGATLFSGLVMGSASGFVGNVGAQVLVEGKSLDCVDYDSAFVSMAAGGLGGSLGAASTGITSIQGLPFLTDFGADIISSSTGGISAGAYDVLFHW